MSEFGIKNMGFYSNVAGSSAISGNSYGSFYDTTIQSATLINTPYPMKLNTSDSPSTSGVVIANDGLGNPSLVTANVKGIYNLQFSAQLQRSSGGTTETIDIWLRKNDSGSTGDLPYTNTKVSLQANVTYLVASWNFFLSLNSGDYVQLMWSTTSTAIQIYYDVANLVVPHPATPSLIVTINKIS